MNAEAILAIRKIQKIVPEKCAGDSYFFDDVLAFDPESDVPSAEAKIRETMGDVADYMGLAPDLAYPIRKTGWWSSAAACTCGTMTTAPPGTKPSRNTTGCHGPAVI